MNDPFDFSAAFVHAKAKCSMCCAPPCTRFSSFDLGKLKTIFISFIYFLFVACLRDRERERERERYIGIEGDWESQRVLHLLCLSSKTLTERTELPLGKFVHRCSVACVSVFGCCARPRDDCFSYWCSMPNASFRFVVRPKIKSMTAVCIHVYEISVCPLLFRVDFFRRRWRDTQDFDYYAHVRCTLLSMDLYIDLYRYLFIYGRI